LLRVRTDSILFPVTVDHPASAARALLVVLILGMLLGQGMTATAQGIRIDPLKDGIILGTGIGLAGLSELLLRAAPAACTGLALDLSGVDPVDRMGMFPYSPEADTMSSILQYASIAMPLLLGAASQPGQTIPTSIAYAESFFLAYGAKNILKYLLPRDRPYRYAGGAPGVDPLEDDQSFPSGHSTMAFTAAAFSAYLYLSGLPGTASYLPLVVTNFGLAALTASYRVVSGMHFITDVMAGAVLGTFCGFFFPALVHGT
jgi:undecaprenyl-diphosphatase